MINAQLPPLSARVRSSFARWLLPGLIAFVLTATVHAEDGYRLWLRYDPITDGVRREHDRKELGRVRLQSPSGAPSATTAAARDELVTGLRGLLGTDVAIAQEAEAGAGAIPVDGYRLRRDPADGVTIQASTDLGLLYGSFALLRLVQTGETLNDLDLTSAPKIQRRLLNHWDNLDRTVERGYAGFSLWEWFYLPDVRSPRYRDYARACASIGINGTVLTNVNADAQILTPFYLQRVAALADEFRPYGVRVYLTARFSAPIELGGLKTADPLDPGVAAWWRAKVDDIYRYIPDFGGFLVKANSEGQPGPQDYHRTHADGANVLADALAPHGGIVMWRAFVYSADNNEDRVKQADSEFAPLDGKFRPNVVVQIKNGPLDFMPREPFSPLFAHMPRTPLAAELQITQEYLGQSLQLAFLAPLWKEALDADTYAGGPGATVGRIVDGSVNHHTLSVIAGVANTGTDINWTGHPLAQANWYAYGRLAWDHALSAETIAREWTRMTFGPDAATDATIERMLLGSRETVVNYSMPLGLHHIMATGHHYGPGPWVGNLERADWNPVYYHRADAQGLGFDRTATGSNALEQYAPEWQKLWGDPATCPENLLLWFHHVPWDHRMKSGRTLWDELCRRYQQGVDEVRAMRRAWEGLQGRIDDERFAAVQQRLARQEKDAVDWRDSCLLYFGTFSKRPLPAGVEAPAHPLEYYESIQLKNMPGH
ncbi:MAG TPA: alpha-glucuronidase family glycosyl hydrolase [Lacunisphaera sp.]|nr:alpha-glucuronidase family glycosyl hydrolase [Lacunisphaera sp.]